MAGTLWVSALLAEVVGYKALMTLHITLRDVAEATLGMSWGCLYCLLQVPSGSRCLSL